MHQSYEQENFYTAEELMNFTNNFTDRTIINITAFIEMKTKNEYTVTKKKMIIALIEQLFQNDIAIFDIQRFLNELWTKTKDDEYTKQLGKDINKFLIETWAKVSERNRGVTDRWVDELKDFD